MPYDKTKDTSPVVMNIMGKPVTEEQYYRAQSQRTFGIDPDNWQAARDMDITQKKHDAANPPIYADVEYGGENGSLRFKTKQYIGSAETLPGIDVSQLQGLKGDGKSDVFTNENGTFVASIGPSNEYPLGKNASFNGQEAKYYGYVQQAHTGETYVPGWSTSATLLGHPEGGQIPTAATGGPYGKAWYTGLPVGTAIGPLLEAGGYNLAPRDGKTRKKVNKVPNVKTMPTVPPPGGGGGGGGTTNPPPGSGGTPSNPPGGIPPRNPWDNPPAPKPPRGPLDYGPAPFDPYPGGDPYNGQGYKGYGTPENPYQKPVFGGASRWQQQYQDWLGGGIDISKYQPEAGGGVAPPPEAGGGAGAPPPPAGGQQQMTWDQWYSQWLSGGGGGGSGGAPTRPN